MKPIPDPWTIADIERLLEASADDAETLAWIAVCVSMDPPEEDAPGWAERVCLSLADHEDRWVRGAAVLGFGHLARTAGVIHDPVRVRAVVDAGLKDPEPHVNGHATSALDDLSHFLGWRPTP
ncbi:MAG: hypothetical protein R3C52_01340 [Hyphomonadaceae bacterium]